jgi:hypothetical protein
MPRLTSQSRCPRAPLNIIARDVLPPSVVCSTDGVDYELELEARKLNSIVGIYDFELFPYALGDVLTWNVRTAMRCEELGRQLVDIYICLDKRYPTGIFQRGMVSSENFELFFSELYTAFGTHPCLGNIFIFREREALLASLLAVAEKDPLVVESVEEYLVVLEHSEKYKARLDTVTAVKKKLDPIKAAIKAALPKKAQEIVFNLAMPGGRRVTEYFDKYIHSHEEINAFSEKFGRIPLLGKSVGCDADVDEFVAQRLQGKKIVPFHLRLRRLDVGYGGDQSYDRDSDFFEWFDFLRTATSQYPDVVFVALGRLQEKPLELLALPNVMSLRSFGMGLGHELTFMNRADLFIGSSSGFAAYANFSSIPYFVTKMNPGACRAYVIPEGSVRLPFAFPKQELVYEMETSEMLMGLLERGLELEPRKTKEMARAPSAIPKTGGGMVDIQAWRNARLQPSNPAATSSRFHTDTDYREAETGFLLEPVFVRIGSLHKEGRSDEALSLLKRVQNNFPELCPRLPEFASLSAMLPH